MLLKAHRLAALVIPVCLCTCGWGASPWRLIRTEHFELYSPAENGSAPRLLARLEQLRAFFLEQSIVKVDGLPSLRVLAFGSQQEYEPYRLRTLSDAYYAGSENRDYIAMSSGGAGEFRIAAHEYAHFVLRSTGRRLPAWLNEGLAEFFSTLRIGENGCELGGDLPAHSQALRRHTWLPISELLALPAESPLRQDRETNAVFYAQSWALVDMLVLSADYGPRFQELMAAIGGGSTSFEAFATVYGRSTEAIERDLHSWVDKHVSKSIQLPGVAVGPEPAEVSDVSSFRLRSILADMLSAGGELDRAEALYRELSRETPSDPDIFAALGTIALHRGNEDAARREWKHAIEQGVTDAAICYRYAVLADMAGLSANEIRPALERAVALRVDFDDARYKLALLEKNEGRYDAALEQFHAMRNVAPGRAFAYWSALADTMIELGQREEAIAAARQAAKHAGSPEERARAAELAYFAQTDLAVQLARDADGRVQMVTTRVPHQAREDWNPFVESGDDLHSVRGALLAVDCSESVTRIRVQTEGRLLTLAIPDPARVRMRNAPEELVCGPQEQSTVLVDYAAAKNGAGLDGLVRGIEFQRAE
jgi:tetratricopeptide (TPR) repeat protein